MSIRRQTVFLVFVSLASAALASTEEPVAEGAQPGQNLILIIPETLPAMAVDPTNAPTLARLKYEGVTFINSHAGFPRLTASDDPFLTATDLNHQALAAAAVGRYTTSFIPDSRRSDGEQGEGLQRLLNVALPQARARNRPFFLIYRLAEPKEAAAGNAVRPAFKPDPRAADRALEAIETSLKSLGLYESTNIVVAAEHSFSRVLKLSHTSRARTLLPREDTLGTLPPGFLAIDLTAAFQTEDPTVNLYDPDHGTSYVDWPSGGFPRQGNGVIAPNLDPSTPYVRVEGHGTFDSIYIADDLPKQDRRHFAQLILEAVLEQDYVGAVFVNEGRVGPLRGAASMLHIAPGSAGTRQPDLVVAFASVDDGCPQPVMCTAVIANTVLAEGEGIPNSFNRAGTWTFMAARGPAFQTRMIDRSPASNADIARTIAELLDLDADLNTRPKGRVLTESLSGDRYRQTPPARKRPEKSKPSIEGRVTEVRLQSLGSALYFDSAVSSIQENLAQAENPRRAWRWPRFKRFTISIEDDDY